jgi:15-cis-phytoene synthase
MDKRAFEIFRRGSVTFFTSSLFFPAAERRDVFSLYSFVRVADDFVDCRPQRAGDYAAFKREYYAAVGGAPAESPVVQTFVELQRRSGFEQSWVDAFFGAMDADLTTAHYETLEDVERYMYGSAEVVGLMMASVLGLPSESHPYARLLGRAFQYINMIRDLEEDARLGRCYLPADRMASLGLGTLDAHEARLRPDAFADFIREQVAQYQAWQARAEVGFRFIPASYRVAVASASDIYRYTARRIFDDPFVVFRRKVKPARGRVLWRVACNALAEGSRAAGSRWRAGDMPGRRPRAIGQEAP